MDRRTTAVWAAAMGVVGAAQLFRSSVEQVVGLVYIIGAVTLAAATIRTDRFTAAVGFGFIATGCASRATAAFTLANPWHSTAIIEATWTLIGLMAYQEARRVIHDVR